MSYEHSGGRAAKETKKKTHWEEQKLPNGKIVFKMKKGVLPTKITKRNGMTKWGLQFWIGKKMPNGSPFHMYAAYSVFTRNLICIGKTSDECRQQIEKKYLKFLKEDI